MPGATSHTTTRVHGLIAGTSTGWAGFATDTSICVLLLPCGTAEIRYYKERAFGLTGSEGNHGEDVKE
jgi:hypothetical protein